MGPIQGVIPIPETVRAYAAEQLAERGRTHALAEHHAAWCLAHLEQDERSREWVERLEADADSLDQAWEWALAQGREELALRLVRGRMRLWERRGRFGQALQALERVLAETEDGPRELRAWVLHDAGVAALMTGDPDAARDHLRASLEVAARGPETSAPARTRILLAFVLTFGGAGSVEDLERAAAEAREIGEDCAAEALAACGQARLFRGEPHLARAHFEASVEEARRRGSQHLLAACVLGLGSAEAAQGECLTAEGHLREAVALAATAGDTPTEVVARTALAELAQVRGAHDEARAAFEECLERARAMGTPYPLARSLLGLGGTILEGCDPEGAQPAFEEATELAQRGAMAHLAVRSLVGRGQAVLALGDIAAANLHLDEAFALARRRMDKAGQALALEGLAELTSRQGDVTKAASHARHALAVHDEVGDPAGVARCLEALGRIAADAGESSIAVRRLGAAGGLRQRRGCARSPSQDREHTAVVDSLRRAVGEEPFANEWRRGAGMSTEAAVADALKQRGRRVLRAPSGWEALTEAERTVAEHAAQGLTNIEIARQLGIAPATVKAHLRRVFAKLGVQTRASLAAQTHRADDDRR